MIAALLLSIGDEMVLSTPPASSTTTIDVMRNVLLPGCRPCLHCSARCCSLPQPGAEFRPQLADRLVKALVPLVPFLDKIEKSLGVTAHLAAPIVAFLAGGWLTWTARGLIGWLATRLFPPFDSELLRPIRRAGVLDPLWLPPIGADRGMQPLPWVVARQPATRSLE